MNAGKAKTKIRENPCYPRHPCSKAFASAREFRFLRLFEKYA